MKKVLLSLALVLLVPVLSPGWGFFGHRTITQIAVYALPSSMQGFYFRHMARLVKLSTHADERRDDDPTEAPKHFIDMDHFGDNPFGMMPKDYDKAVAKYTADTLNRYGTVPWTILDVQERLTQAFKERDTTAIIALSADLNHYVSDAFVPLHTTENYDGQLTKQTGMHALWESKLPEMFIAEYKLITDDKAEYLKDPKSAIWKVIQDSYGFLGATFDYETEVSKRFNTETKFSFSHKYGKTRRSYSDAFATAYHKKVGGMVMHRLRGAPVMVASMWLTAWRDAGSPNLDAFMQPAKLSKEEKQQLDEQLTAWKKNLLVEQNMLLSMQKAAAATPEYLVDAVAPGTAPAAPSEAAQPAAETGKAKEKRKSDDGKKEKVKTKTKKEKEDDSPFGDK